MSLSLYYSAKRETPLSAAEWQAVKAITNQFSKAVEIERYANRSKGLNWEDFCIYDASKLEVGTALQGATHLPDNSAFAVYKGARHWVQCLNQIRRQVLPSATWSAHIDEKPLLWDDKHGWHDRASDGLASIWLGCLLSAPFRLFV